MVNEHWDAPEEALRQARKTAHRAHQQCRGYLDYEDLVSVGYEWIARHKGKTLEWCDREKHPSGWKALGVSMLRYMNRAVAKERAARTGGSTEDAFYYSPAVIEELLPVLWDVEDRRPSQVATEPDAPKRKQLPGEGMNREASLSDVSRAVQCLAEEEKALLQSRYFANLTLAEIARMRGVSEDTVTRHLRNTIRTMNDYLGGESPWRRRRSRSNAAAQAETRNQWEGDER